MHPQGSCRNKVSKGLNASYWPRGMSSTSPRDSLFMWTALSSQLSALSSQLSALSSQLSALSSQLSALSCQLSALSFPNYHQPLNSPDQIVVARLCDLVCHSNGLVYSL